MDKSGWIQKKEVRLRNGMGAAPPAHVNAPTQPRGLVLGEAALPGSLGPPWGFKADVPHYSSEEREGIQTNRPDRQTDRKPEIQEDAKPERQTDRRTDRQPAG